MSDYNIYKREEQPHDPVNRPKHYTQGGMETLDMIKNTLSKESYEGFLVGNIIKYTSRYKFKNGIEDLRKSEFYIKRLIGEYDTQYLK